MAKPLERPLEEIAFLSEFADWCRTKGDERYDYLPPDGCALCRFLREAKGMPDARVNPQTWRAFDRSKERFPLPAGLDHALCYGRRTFSALATRIDALIPARAVPAGDAA